MSDTTSLEKRPTAPQSLERTRSGRTYVPTVDIIERDDELLLLADVPGAAPEGVDVQYERGVLTLTARVDARQDERTNYVWHEYGVGDYVRTFQVGESIDAAKIEAELSNGVLTLHLPKAAAARSRKIEVRTA